MSSLTSARLLLADSRLGYGFRTVLESETAVEIETENVVPPHDIMDFLSRPKSSGVEATEPAPLTRFAVPLSDEAVKEARKAAVPQTTQKDVLLV